MFMRNLALNQVPKLRDPCKSNFFIMISKVFLNFQLLVFAILV